MPPLKIGFDVTPILYNRGVSRYTSNIVRALGNLSEPPELRLFGSSFRANRSLKTMALDLASEAHVKSKPTVLAFPPSFLKTMWYSAKRLSIESLMEKVDVFHAWEELIPPTYKTPTVATIHDLALFKFEMIAHPQTKEKHTLALKRLLETKSHVIAVSQTTKRDLLELFSFPEDHIHVVPEAVPSEIVFDKKTLIASHELKKFGLTRPYMLWVGVNEPRKNLDRIIESWRAFKKDYDLVLVGSAGLDQVKPEQGIKKLGGVGMTELAALYATSSGLVFPSLYEGFGLPILEAFQYGCPVVTSNTSSMSEVSADAAFLVDPSDVDSIKQGITEMLEKGKLPAKQKKMKERLGSFSWKKSAEMTLEVYRKAKNGRA
ncbi:MAG: glycosyltransferase family 1 protein [Candidatus Woesebacteria bacterium]